MHVYVTRSVSIQTHSADSSSCEASGPQLFGHSVYSIDLVVREEIESQRKEAQQETFKGENFHEFRGFVAIRESFLCEIWKLGIIWLHQPAICKNFLCENLIFHQFVKVFSCESFPLYSMWSPPVL